MDISTAYTYITPTILIKFDLFTFKSTYKSLRLVIKIVKKIMPVNMRQND